MNFKEPQTFISWKYFFQCLVKIPVSNRFFFTHKPALPQTAVGRQHASGSYEKSLRIFLNKSQYSKYRVTILMAVGLANTISFFKGTGFSLIVNRSCWWSAHWCLRCAIRSLCNQTLLAVCKSLMDFATLPHLTGSVKQVVTTRICRDGRDGKQCNL